ncbi:MAG: glycosyltransferase family 4 protein [Eubacteriales bacterium]
MVISMKQKKICLFINSLQKGGAERVMVNLAKYFSEEGYQVVLVTQHRAKEEYPLVDGIPRIFSEITSEEETSNRIVNFKRRYDKLRKIWKTEKPDVILSFIGKNNVMTLLTAAGLWIPVVVSVRADPKREYASRSLKMAANFTFPWAKKIVMQTTESKLFFRKAIQKKVVILKNPLNPTFVRPIYEGEREKTIIAVGRVDQNKNHQMLVEAFAQIADQYPEYQLIIYGDGESRSSIQEWVCNRKFEDRIFLPGAITNVADEIARAGIYVLTSKSEGMPNSLMEAMALGIPCISTDCPCGGAKDLIEDGKNGILVSVGDVNDLASQLSKLIEEPEVAINLGRQASKLQDTHNPDVVNASWKELIENVG